MQKKNRHPFAENDGINTQTNSIAPIVSGQCAEVLCLIREHQPILAMALAFEHGIPQYNARISNLRDIGFNIKSTPIDCIVYQGREYRNAVKLSMGTPEWIKPARPAQPENLTPDLFEDGGEA